MTLYSTPMAMTGGLYRATAADIEKLVDEPESIEEFMEASTWAPPVREVRPKGVLGWLMKLTPVTVLEVDPAAEPPQDYDPANDRPHCDLEGVWHGLHFLFTGTAWEGEEPAGYLIRGGEEIGNADELGYYVLQALSPARVEQFSAFLRRLSREELERRFNPARLAFRTIDRFRRHDEVLGDHRSASHDRDISARKGAGRV